MSDDDLIRRGDAPHYYRPSLDPNDQGECVICGGGPHTAVLPAVTPGVKVKPLVWENARDGYPFKWQAWCNLMAGYYYADSDGQKREHEAVRAARILAALDLTTPPAPIPTSNCVICGRLVDTREVSEGGDGHGCEYREGWTCSSECAEKLHPDPDWMKTDLEKIDLLGAITRGKIQDGAIQSGEVVGVRIKTVLGLPMVVPYSDNQEGDSSLDLPPQPAPDVARLVDTFYIDCEFDGHNGPLLSIAMVRGDGRSVYIKVGDVTAKEPWVIANVLPILNSDNSENTWDVFQNDVGVVLRMFLRDCQNPTIIADSPVDIGRFCQAISTGPDKGWQSTDFSRMTFSVRNIDCYPTTLKGAVQHNAWWDAMALRAALAAMEGKP